MIMNSRFNDDRSSMRKRKFMKELDDSVLIYVHSGPIRSETMEQTAFVPWFDLNYPQYKLSLFHVPNETQSAIQHQVRLNSMGRRSGCSDLILGLPSKICPYVCIEFKKKGGEPSEDQIKFLNHHLSLGALCVIVYGNEAARRFIKEYLQYV